MAPKTPKERQQTRRDKVKRLAEEKLRKAAARQQKWRDNQTAAMEANSPSPESNNNAAFASPRQQQQIHQNNTLISNNNNTAAAAPASSRPFTLPLLRSQQRHSQQRQQLQLPTFQQQVASPAHLSIYRHDANMEIGVGQLAQLENNQHASYESMLDFYRQQDAQQEALFADQQARQAALSAEQQALLERQQARQAALSAEQQALLERQQARQAALSAEQLAMLERRQARQQSHIRFVDDRRLTVYDNAIRHEHHAATIVDTGMVGSPAAGNVVRNNNNQNSSANRLASFTNTPRRTRQAGLLLDTGAVGSPASSTALRNRNNSRYSAPLDTELCMGDFARALSGSLSHDNNRSGPPPNANMGQDHHQRNHTVEAPFWPAYNNTNGREAYPTRHHHRDNGDSISSPVDRPPSPVPSSYSEESKSDAAHDDEYEYWTNLLRQP